MRVAAVVLAVALVAAAPARPAGACQCVVQPLAKHAENAAAVFTGTVVAREPPAAEVVAVYPDGSSAWRLLHPWAAWTFAVDGVQKGGIGRWAEVRSGLGAGDCGYVFRVGGRYRVYAAVHEGALYTSTCHPTGPVGGAHQGVVDVLVILGAALWVTAALRRRHRARGEPGLG